MIRNARQIFYSVGRRFESCRARQVQSLDQAFLGSRGGFVARDSYRGTMSPQSRATGRQRGRIDTLPSGSLRVKVYAGQPPLSFRLPPLISRPELRESAATSVAVAITLTPRATGRRSCRRPCRTRSA